jgi:UrcA family protein
MKTIHSLSIRRFVASAIIGTLAIGIAAVSLADDSQGVRKMTVKFGDLNLSTSEGAAELYTRIRTAAKIVCAPDYYAPWPFGTGAADCVNKAVTDAVKKVNRAELIAVYNQHNKTPLASPLLSQTR